MRGQCTNYSLCLLRNGKNEDHSSAHSFNKFSILNTSAPLVFSSSFSVPAPTQSFGGITSSPFLLSLLGSVGVISVSGTWPTISLLVFPILLAVRISSRMAETQRQPRGTQYCTFTGNTGKERDLFPLGWPDWKKCESEATSSHFATSVSFSWQLRSLELVDLGPYANPKGS